MKYLVASFILFMCTLQTFCQQEYFVYLQTDNNQAFYVRLNNKVYSSTIGGYLILPKMTYSPVAITIGFAKSVSPEQQFNIPVSNNDVGYIVKNFDEKGWGLYNLQTQAVVMNSNPLIEKKNLAIDGIKKTDEFSLLLANAVNDTAVLYSVNKPKKLEPAPVVVAVEEKKVDSTSIAKIDTIKKDTTAALAKNQPETKDSSIIRKVIAKPDTIKTDTVALAKKQPEKKDSSSITKVIAKPDTVETATTTLAKNQPEKKDSSSITKVIAKPDRIDTVTVTKTAPPVIKEKTPEKIQEKYDSTVVAKNTTSPNTTSPTTIPKITNSIKNLFGFGKTETKPRKDTIIIIDTNAAAKNKDRKDTIIMMQHAGAEKAISKNTVPPNETKLQVVPSTTTKDSAASIPVKKHRPAIAKAAELFTDTSYVAIFVDESKGKSDTIRISIPFNEAATVKNKPIVKEVKPDTITGSKIKKDNPVVVKEQPVPVTIKDTTSTTETDTNKTVKAPSLSVNSDCKEVALDADIDKLRIKMMQASSDEEKIAFAKKLYRLKCFSVKQVKALSELFKTDEGKYKWLDATYPFVSDNNNFSSLGELIKNEYYLNRFKAMLRN